MDVVVSVFQNPSTSKMMFGRLSWMLWNLEVS